MRIGLSLSVGFILGTPSFDGEKELLNLYYKPQAFLNNLVKQGLTNIELFDIPYNMSSEMCQKAADIVWNQGLNISIHGSLPLENIQRDSFIDIYPSLSGIIKRCNKYQDKIPLTIHAYRLIHKDINYLRNKTICVMKNWCSSLAKDNSPILLSVELLPGKADEPDPSTTCNNVENIIKEINSPYAGICWDMGHYYSNLKNNWDLSSPSHDFLTKVNHTHIHGLGIKGNHCPLITPKSLPLENYINDLKQVNYEGIYNLEFKLGRFPKDAPLDILIFKSIERLKLFI